MRDLSTSREGPLIGAGPGVQTLPPAVRFVLRGGEPVRAAAQRALGVPVAATPCRAGVAGERAALWLGPDEWLLLGTPADAGIEALRAGALAGLPHSLVDVSHRQIALAVRGPQAATLIASGCPLDLDARAFPLGMCTRTMLGKCEVVLWRTRPEEFRLEVWRSFAAYVAHYLAEAARGMN
ncbi:MAG TPA: sarcosine oxidase subunit gamma family protein [Steroidobacteraceae bacterium]|nr:sarcosine oxidase subunit gamma family protein [Steroidobacteraceae bacterium]